MFHKGQIIYQCFFPYMENDPFTLRKYEITECPDELTTDGQIIKYKYLPPLLAGDHETTFAALKNTGVRASEAEAIVWLINQLAQKVANACLFIENTSRAMVTLEAQRRISESTHLADSTKETIAP